MTKYRIDERDGDPVVIATIFEDFNPTEDVQDLARDLNTTFDGLGTPAYLVLDRSQAAPVNMDDVQVGSNVMARQSGMNFHHPNMIEVIVVTTDVVIRQAFAGMQSEVYGRVKMHLVEAIDEAFAYIQEKLG